MGRESKVKTYNHIRLELLFLCLRLPKSALKLGGLGRVTSAPRPTTPMMKPIPYIPIPGLHCCCYWYQCSRCGTASSTCHLPASASSPTSRCNCSCSCCCSCPAICSPSSSLTLSSSCGTIVLASSSLSSSPRPHSHRNHRNLGLPAPHPA
jgi:hypothetical protein